MHAVYHLVQFENMQTLFLEKRAWKYVYVPTAKLFSNNNEFNVVIGLFWCLFVLTLT